MSTLEEHTNRQIAAVSAAIHALAPAGRPDAHTPGPWDVQNKGDLGTRSARVEVVAGHFRPTDLDHIPTLPTIARLPGLTEEHYANARLMAAAPDLLAAAQDVLDVYRRDSDDDTSLRFYNVVLENLRAAVARAEGSA